MRSRRISKWRRLLELFLLVAGLAGVGVWVWSQARLAISQKEAKQALEQRLPSRPAPQPQNLANGELLGRLAIPRLHLSAAVREGAGHDTLDVALGHIPGTAMPGGKGNVGVAGHRDTLFRGLRNIHENDIIDFQTPEGSYQYQVTSTEIVKPQDTEVLKAGSRPEMTLVTCYPFYYVGPAPDRFIVKARLVSQPEAGTKPPNPPPVHVAAAAPKPPAAKTSVRKVAFHVEERQTCLLAPGILLSLTWTDPVRQRANGWLRIAGEGRTIWLHNLAVRQPLLFHQRELMITRVSRSSMAGYVLLFTRKS